MLLFAWGKGDDEHGPIVLEAAPHRVSLRFFGVAPLEQWYIVIYGKHSFANVLRESRNHRLASSGFRNRSSLGCLPHFACIIYYLALKPNAKNTDRCSLQCLHGVLMCKCFAIRALKVGEKWKQKEREKKKEKRCRSRRRSETRNVKIEQKWHYRLQEPGCKKCESLPNRKLVRHALEYLYPFRCPPQCFEKSAMALSPRT